MLPDQPSARELLQTARSVLKKEILPTVPADKTLDVLMILKVLEIADRALADSTDALIVRQKARAESLLGAGGDAAALAAAIRAGAWDTAEAAQRLHRVLTEDVCDRLARANPKYLRTIELDG